MRADLHVHTKWSDGRLTFPEVQAKAAPLGIDWLIAADHDSTGCMCDTRHTRRPILAVEVTALHDGEDVHVLGYFKYAYTEEFDWFLSSQRFMWGQRFKKVYGGSKKFGKPPYRFDQAGLQSLIDCIAAYEKSSRPDVYRKWFARGRPYHMSGGRFPSLAEAIRLIYDNHGLSVLAHPGMGELGARIPSAIVETACRKWGLRGVEVYTPFHSPEVTAEYRKLAQDLGLLITGGSDFHCDQWQAVVAKEGRGGLGASYVEGEEFDRFLDVLFD